MHQTEQRFAEFHRDGCVFPLRVLSAEQASHYRRCLEAHEAIRGHPLQGNLRHKTHLLFRWADELVHNTDILDAVSDVNGLDIRCWTTNLFIKEADSPGFVSWHQDSIYWGLDPDDVVTAWVAFTDATPENGYMQIIPGTHKVEQLPHLDTFHRDNLLSRGQEIAVDVDTSKAVGVALKAGEMSLHHIKLVHGSQSNRSADRRIGLAIRYIPISVRQTKVRDSGMLVRGVDRIHHFDEEPRPQADLDAAATRGPRRRGQSPGKGAVPGHRQTGVSRLSARPARENLRKRAMTPEQILDIPPRILTQTQREFYFREGYILLEKIIGDEWIARLRQATDDLVERSRSITKSDHAFDLEPDHRPSAPRLRRVSNPTEHHPVFWDYVNHSVMPDAVADLVGPDVKFHHSKLNFKWSNGGEEVKWHYDISFWPHTNYSPLTIGTYLYDCGMSQGPLGVIPRSHRIEPMLDQYNENGQWVGCLNERDIERIDVSKAVYLTGPAGSLTLHNCRMVHGSPRNDSDQGRPLLLYTLTSSDAFPYTVNPIKPAHDQAIIRGKRASFAHHDPRPCLIPPDWSSGYTSIFSLQQREDSDGQKPGVTLM